MGAFEWQKYILNRDYLVPAAVRIEFEGVSLTTLIGDSAFVQADGTASLIFDISVRSIILR
jgi:hypothetical protein